MHFSIFLYPFRLYFINQVRVLKEFFLVDRVGFFLVDWKNYVLHLKISQDGELMLIRFFVIVIYVHRCAL